MVNIAHGALKRQGMKINVNMTKVTVFVRKKRMTDCNILIKGEKVEWKSLCIGFFVYK